MVSCGPPNGTRWYPEGSEETGACTIDLNVFRTPRWRACFGAITLLLAATLVLLGCWATYHAPGRNDQYQLIQLGQCVYHHGTMYVDCWENKPPGIAWTNALGLLLTRGDPIGPWLLPGAFEALTVLILWASLRRIVSERAARKTVLVAALVYSLRLFDTPSINPDFYSSILELAALALLVRGAVAPLGATWEETVQGHEGPSMRQEAIEGGVPSAGETQCTCSYFLCALAGLCWAAATSFKQIGCVGLLVLTICTLVAAIFVPRLRTHAAKAAASVWTGFILGAGAVVVVLWQQGTLKQAWDAIYTFNAGLLNGNDLLAAVGNRARMRSELAPLVLPLWLGLTGVIMSFWYRRFRGFPLTLTLGIVFWWVAEVALAAMGPSHSIRYWQATFPPMLILAAVGLYYIQQVQDRLDHPERLTAFVVAVTVAIMLARPALFELRAGLAGSYAAYEDHPTEREQLEEIASRIRELTNADDRIYVLDYRPGIYVYADRLPAARFNYPRSPEQIAELTTQLAAHPPRLIVVPEKPAPEFERLKSEEYRTFVAGILRDCEIAGKVHNYILFRCGGTPQ